MAMNFLHARFQSKPLNAPCQNPHNPSALPKETSTPHFNEKDVNQKQMHALVCPSSSSCISASATDPHIPRTSPPATKKGAPSPPSPEAIQQARPGSIRAYREEFVLVISFVGEYENRIDSLRSVLAAIMKIEVTSGALNDARNPDRLPWQATLSVLFNLIVTAFCMRPHVTAISSKF